MVKCPSCGAGMKFDPASQKLVCDFCSTVENPENVKISKNAAAQSNADVETYETFVFTCPDCGAEIMSNDDTAVTFCSYCGNSVTLTGRLTKLTRPDRIIPFKKTLQECSKNYLKLINHALFAPSKLTSDTSIDNFRGIYMPYWTYGLKRKASVKIFSHKDRRQGSYIYRDNYSLNSDYECEYDGLSYDASTGFADRFSNAIAPFDINDAVDFNESYMAGFYADAGDMDSKAYSAEAYKVYQRDIDKNLLGTQELKEMTVAVGSTSHSLKEEEKIEKLSYFPVWFLANKYGDKVSYAVVNGQTGEVAADIPISYPRLIAGSIILALPIICLLNFVVSLRPSTLLIFTILFSLISIFLASSQADELYVRSNYFDDIGMQIKRFGTIQNLSIFTTKKHNNINVNLSGAILSTITPILGIGFMFLMLMMGVDENLAIILYVVIAFLFSFVARWNLLGKQKENVSKTRLEIHQPLDEKVKYYIKPLIAIVMSITVLVISPTMDYWYYGITMVAMLLTLLSFYDLVVLHNKLTLRKPPQFKKRGGDEL